MTPFSALNLFHCVYFPSHLLTIAFFLSFTFCNPLSVQGQMFVAFSEDRDHYAVSIISQRDQHIFYIGVYSVRDPRDFQCGWLQIPTRGLLVLLTFCWE